MMAHPYEVIDDHKTSSRDLAHLFIGKQLGYGMSRHVYEMEHSPSYVIKWEAEGKDFQNALEWRVWQAVKDFPKYARWFAPCLDISPNGVWLIQEKVKLIPKNKYPKKLPDYLGDTKYMNFGLLAGKVVACDYGTPSFARLFSFNSKMTKTEWWGDHPDG